MANLADINLAMQTLFGSDGAIDYDAVKHLIDAYIDAGVQVQSLVRPAPVGV